MAESDKKISQLDLAVSFPVGSLIVASLEDEHSESGYASFKVPSELLASQILSVYSWPLLLNTTSKSVTGAINELNGKVYKVELSATLSAGSTSIGVLDAAITPSSTIDIYTDKWGVNPESVSVSTGRVDMIFEAQASDLGVKVRVS